MILNVLSHSFPWNPKSGSVPLSKTKMASAPRFPGEINLDLAHFPRQHCHYGSYPGRKRSTANRQRNRSIDRHHGGMVKVYLKIPEELVGLSSFVMFPYVSICFHLFQYVTKKHLPCLAPILEVSEMCSTGWAFFFVPTGVADGYLSA
jgi:hypothetical protein